MAIGSSWFTNTDQYNIFKASLDRSQLIVKQAQALRMEKQLADLNDKYDGQKAAGIEEEINKLYDQKTSIANYLSNVEFGQKRMDDVRTQLQMARNALSTGSGAAFDLAINSVNSWVGRQTSDPDSLIANNGTNSGTWSQDTTVLSGAGLSVAVSHQFMGSDYALVFDDGSVSRPEKDGRSFSGGLLNGVNMSDLTLTAAADGSYSLVNPNTGQTENVEIRRGGVGLLNAWGYGNLEKPDDGFDPSVPPDPADAAAVAAWNQNLAKYDNRARAQADIDTAFKKLAQMERNLNMYESGLSAIVNGLDSKSEQLTDEYTKVSEEELTAKQAERRAIETRFNIATNAMALSNETASTLIYQMFMKPSTTEKQDLTSIMLSAVGG